MSAPQKAAIAAKRARTRKRNAAARKLHATRRRNRILKQGGAEAASVRLGMAGCVSKEAMQRRILWLAHEWKLTDAEIKDAMKCRSENIARFVKQYPGVNCEWLLVGDLRGFQQMQPWGRR